MKDTEYTSLIEDMIQETRELELEIVSLRYLLSTCMQGKYKYDLRSEIYTNINPEFRDNPEYEKYIKTYFHGRDPFNTREYNQRLQKQAQGNLETYRHYHPNICLEGLSDHLQVIGHQIIDINH